MKKIIHYQAAAARKLIAGFFVFAALAITIGMAVAPNTQVRADSLEDQISQLQQANAVNRNALKQLRDEAISYQDALARLRSQMSILQGQIDANLAQQADLQAKIDEGQRQLTHQRAVLGENIRTMYLEGQISTIEILATSKNLSDFVDKEEYRTAVKNKIQDTLKRIAQLQNELNAQKTQVEALLKAQQEQQSQLQQARAEQTSMLAYNQSQQADYNKKTKDNQARIDALIAQQRRANDDVSGGYYFLRFEGAVREFDPDEYPYANAGFGMSTAPGCTDNDGPDRWGYCTRQCVSYAAWAVEASGRSAPRYYGNAKNWVAAARSKGVPVHLDPKPGDVAISTAGTWGHAMYVERVDGNQIYVSQYNQQLTGRYSTQWRTFR